MIEINDMFEYVGDIVAKPRMTRADTWKHRPIVDRYYAFKDSIVLQAREQNFMLGDAFSIVFMIPVPESWSQVKREKFANVPHRSKPDVDNLVKGVMDCLLKQDSVVWHIDATKIWTLGEPKIVIINIDEGDQGFILDDCVNS